MFRLKDWLELWDTPGGHLVLLLFLFLVGVAMTRLGIDGGKDTLVGAFAALLTSLTVNKKREG